MAFASADQPLIVEPLTFHQAHGDQIRLTDNNTRATRDRLNNTLLFTNRPILPNEILQFQIEDVSTEFYGLMRFGLTTINPASFTSATFPKSMPTNNDKDWLIPPPRTNLTLQKNQVVRLRYTSSGEVCRFEKIH